MNVKVIFNTQVNAFETSVREFIEAIEKGNIPVVDRDVLSRETYSVITDIKFSIDHDSEIDDYVLSAMIMYK